MYRKRRFEGRRKPGIQREKSHRNPESIRREIFLQRPKKGENWLNNLLLNGLYVMHKVLPEQLKSFTVSFIHGTFNKVKIHSAYFQTSRN